MGTDEYESQKDYMARLARREGWSDQKFEDLYGEFIDRAKAEQRGQSLAYQLCRGECWIWKVHFRRYGPFRGIEPPRDTALPPHIYRGGSYDRYTPRKSTRSRSRSPRAAAYRRSPARGGENNQDSWAQMAVRLSSQAGMTNISGLTNPPENVPASGPGSNRSSQIIAHGSNHPSEEPRLRLSVATENKQMKDTRLFFPPDLHGYPRYSHLLRQRNALPAFIGPKSTPKIRYLEKHYPHLHFRKAHVKEGLLIWVELPLEVKRDGFKLSRFDREMLESADALLKCFAGLKNDTLPDIDIFVKRYCDGAYDA